MRKFSAYILTLALFAVPFTGAMAAPPEVSVSMKPDSILIGDHVTLRIEVRKDMMQVVEFPTFGDKGPGGNIVVVKDMPVDTLSVSGREQVLAKEYILTSFREGGYDLGKVPVLYLDKNITDTLFVGQDLKLLVTTFEVDTASTTIFDIKPPVNTPMMVDEVRGYVRISVLAACVLAAVIWFITRAVARRRAKTVTEGGKPKPKVQPHVRAIRELEHLHNQKLWQNSKHKQYYTRLTDVLREYLEGRYGIGAMEMTSDEIMAAAVEAGLTDRNFDSLNDILRTADLVKFAKFIPAPDYNETAYYNAYYFVEDTKEVAEEVKESEVTEIRPGNIPAEGGNDE